MWQWLLSWFRRSGPDLYRPRERLIYRYFDGRRTVAADPQVLYKRLMAVGPELSIDITVAQSPSQDAAKASDAAVAKIRGIFGLKPLEEGGLTEIEAGNLLDHFVAYCEAVKKNSRTPATSAPSSPAPSPPASAAGGPATASSSGSGSTASGASTGPPEPSVSAPASP